jgi:hypothetical protein
MSQDLPPVSLEEISTITTWEEAWAFSQRGILEQRALKDAMPQLETDMVNSRNAWQAAKDRSAALQQIMVALIARGPELE